MQSGESRNDVVVVIPALNEAENLEWLLPTLLDTVDVIVVDNGSTDGTAQVAREAGALVLDCPVKGYGRAVLTAFDYVLTEASRYKVVVVFDADGTSPAEDIPGIVAPILAGNASMVLGQRTSKELGAMPPHAKFGNDLTVFLIWVLTGVFYKDLGSLRALRLADLRKLNMQDLTWGWNVEMQMKVAMLELEFAEVDIRYRPRKYGKSKISGSILGSIRAGVKILYAVGYYYFAAKKLLQTANGQTETN